MGEVVAMTRIVLDSVVIEKLLSHQDVLELCDQSGQVIGHFTPTMLEVCDQSGRVVGHFTPATELQRVLKAMPQLSAEELDRRRGEPRYTTAEVLAYLEKL